MVATTTEEAPETTTHFGFKDVPLTEKQTRVDDVFHKVASRYDLMNDLMSAGLHRVWKNHLISTLRPPRMGEFRHLDVAGGTGDIAFRVLEAGGAGVEVDVLDINSSMLAVGEARAAQKGLSDRLRFIEGNAESLPFADKTYDAYTIAFGIRNVPRIPLALQEAWRVLKRGGRLLVLEFAPVEMPGLREVYDVYSFNLLPPLGKMVTGDGEPYRYLVESIRKFPTPDRFSSLIEAAGFARVTYRPLSFGIANLHSAWKI